MEPYHTWSPTLVTTDPFITTGRPSMKVFPNTLWTHCKHNCRSTTAYQWQGASKNSGHHPWSKFAEANYITVFTLVKVHIFDSEKATITISTEPIIRGWNDKQTGLWWVPILPGPAKKKPPNQALMLTKITPKQQTMYMNSQPQYKLYSTTMLQQGSHLRPHG